MPAAARTPREPCSRAAPRAERHTIESLDSLAVDIARMIDHDAAAELWDRYKRGERNVFTRKLYTMQGQKAFDEIRRKYRGDRDFKQTVDRYIGEFERLLEEVSRDDRGQVVARTYLTIGDRQGLYHACARSRPARLNNTTAGDQTWVSVQRRAASWSRAWHARTHLDGGVAASAAHLKNELVPQPSPLAAPRRSI